MKDLMQELEECFNAIPKDGSNIKEEDDDNGYASLGSDVTVTFDQKATELSDVVSKSNPTVLLERTTIEVSSGTQPPAVSPNAASEIDSLLMDAVTDKPATQEATGDVLDSLAPEKAARGARGKTPKRDVVPTAVEEAVVPIEPKKTPEIDPIEMATLAQPVTESAPEKLQNDVAETADVIAPVEVRNDDKKPVEPVKLEPENADKNNSEQPVIKTEKVADTLDEDGFDSDGWILTTSVKQYEDFYRKKRWSLKRLSPLGRLPFQRWEKELSESKADVECSYDTTAMFEQMKFIQSLKVRVTDIIVQLNSQYFKWKRFMVILRHEAARMEGTKVAQGDAAALRHLPDFEDYFGDLESLMETSEGVMKNLESGWNTLNRGVTIVLQAQGHERGMTRYEPNHGDAPQASKALFPMSQFDDLKGMDALDAEEPQTPPKQKGSDGWGDVKW